MRWAPMATCISIWGDDMDSNYYTAFSAEYTAGDAMMIATADTPFAEFQDLVFNAKSLWFYDGVKYRLVIWFEELENGITIYFFNDIGEIASHTCSGDG